ncbi:cyclophilin-like fold protein [Planctomycetota bacterium]
MPQKIMITAENVQVEAELNDSPTAQSIVNALPLEALAQRWGGEIYFSIEVEAELEEGSRDVLKEGELAFWPPGNAFCIFFGPTPASQGKDIRAASAVNIIGKMTGDWSGLWDVPDGGKIVIKTAEGAKE